MDWQLTITIFEDAGGQYYYSVIEAFGPEDTMISYGWADTEDEARRIAKDVVSRLF